MFEGPTCVLFWNELIVTRIVASHLFFICAWYKSEDLARFGGGVLADPSSGLLSLRPSRC